MKVAKLLYLFLPLALAVAASGQDSPVERPISGRSPSPRIDANGRLALLYVNGNNRLSIGRENSPGGQIIVQEDISASEVPSFPVLKTDRLGRLWGLWTEETASAGRLIFGRVSDTGFAERKAIASTAGSDSAPDFDFDPSNAAWIAWIRSSKGSCEVVVRETGHNGSWTISSPLLVSASRVRVLADGPGKIWIIWSGRETGRDEVFWSRFDGSSFSAPARLNADNAVPHLFPDAARGAAGNPWIVWSAYNGHDYEIFISRRTDSGWTGEFRLTNDPGSDSFPSLVLANGVPVVMWSRVRGSRTSLLVRYCEAGIWQPEKVIYSGGEREEISDPKAASRGGRMVFCWQSQGTIRSKSMTLDGLRALGSGPLSAKAQRSYRPAVREASLLKDSGSDTYIGFGDSITYGILNGENRPELGYIPRLEALLDQNFGPSTIINEGSPGEITVNGLGRMSDVLAADAAGYLFLMEGTNDVAFLEISPDATAFNLEQMILKCRNAGVFPVISTIIPRSDWRWNRKAYRDRIYAINDQIRRIGQNLKVPLVDMFNTFFNYPEADGGWESLLSDTVHPNELGYTIMAQAWWNEIKDLPFPPANVTADRTTERALLSSRIVNHLTWEHNPKISNPFRFRSYRIYRQDLTDAGSSAQLITVLPYSPFHNPQKFNDLDIRETHRYRYVISLLRLDEVEGPLSDPAGDTD